MAYKRGLTLHVLLSLVFPPVALGLLLARLRRTGPGYGDRFQPFIFLKLGNGLFWGCVLLVLAGLFGLAVLIPDTAPRSADTIEALWIFAGLWVFPWVACGVCLIAYSVAVRRQERVQDAIRQALAATLVRGLDELAAMVGRSRPALDRLVVAMIVAERLPWRIDPADGRLVPLDPAVQAERAAHGRSAVEWSCPACGGRNAVEAAPGSALACVWCGAPRPAGSART